MMILKKLRCKRKITRQKRKRKKIKGKKWKEKEIDERLPLFPRALLGEVSVILKEKCELNPLPPSLRRGSLTQKTLTTHL